MNDKHPHEGHGMHEEMHAAGHAEHGAHAGPPHPAPEKGAPSVLSPRGSRRSRFSTAVLGVAHRHYTRPDPVALNSVVCRPQWSAPLPRRSIRSLHFSIVCVLLRRLPFPEGDRQRAAGVAPRDDDAYRCRHQHGVPLQDGDHVRLKRRRPLLGAEHLNRHHAPRPLDRDAVGSGGVASP